MCLSIVENVPSIKFLSIKLFICDIFKIMAGIRCIVVEAQSQFLYFYIQLYSSLV